MNVKQVDVVIVGGGLAGAALACAVGELGLSIAVLEAYPPQHQSQPSFDDRSTALAEQTIQLLNRWNVWEKIQHAQPIAKIHVSDQKHFAKVRMDAQEYGLTKLGAVVSNRLLGAALWSRLEELEHVSLHNPVTVKDVQLTQESGAVTTQVGQELTQFIGSLVVGADGQNSVVRKAMNVDTRTTNYNHFGLITNVETELSHKGCAFERFTANGPLAMLPLRENVMSLVWSIPATWQQQAIELDDAAFLETLQAEFGWYLGELKRVGKRVIYPLKLVQAEREVATRSVLIGNSAHTLHPIAGQGLNLTMRDIAVLAKLLEGPKSIVADPEPMLSKYTLSRHSDQRKTVYATDFLNRWFSSDAAPSKLSRHAAMQGLAFIPPIRRQLMKHALGFVWK